MSISIIIPMYNVQDYLKECLDSIMTNVSDYEVLLIDDGSLDNTGDIAMSYAKKYPTTVFYYYKENGGGNGDAKNFGIPLAKKEYILFLDSDDFLKDKAIDTCNNILEATKADILVFDLEVYYSKSRKFINKIYTRDSSEISNFEYLTGNIVAAWNKVIRKSIIVENHIYFSSKVWYEDLATTPMYINHANKVYYLSESLYFYRQREASIMHQTEYNPKMMDMIKAISRIYDYFKGSEYQQEIENLCIHHLLFHHSIRLFEFNKKNEIRICVSELFNKFPKWRKNKYFKERSFAYRVYCYCVSLRLFSIAKILLRLRTKENKM